MRHLSPEEVSKMSKDELMAEICTGLAEVCESMANDRNRYLTSQLIELNKFASEFRGLARFWEKQKQEVLT